MRPIPWRDMLATRWFPSQATPSKEPEEQGSASGVHEVRKRFSGSREDLISRRMSSSEEEDSERERKKKRMRESESGEAMFGLREERERENDEEENDFLSCGFEAKEKEVSTVFFT